MGRKSHTWAPLRSIWMALEKLPGLWATSRARTLWKVSWKGTHSYHQDHLHDQEGKGRRVSSKVVEDFFKRFAKTAEGCRPQSSTTTKSLGWMTIRWWTRPFSKKEPSMPSRSEITRNPKSASCSAETASGKLLPLYVIYKATNCWELSAWLSRWC